MVILMALLLFLLSAVLLVFTTLINFSTVYWLFFLKTFIHLFLLINLFIMIRLNNIYIFLLLLLLAYLINIMYLNIFLFMYDWMIAFFFIGYHISNIVVDNSHLFFFKLLLIVFPDIIVKRIDFIDPHKLILLFMIFLFYNCFFPQNFLFDFNDILPFIIVFLKYLFNKNISNAIIFDCFDLVNFFIEIFILFSLLFLNFNIRVTIVSIKLGFLEIV
eukprot:GHVR01166982.1.p1 GENE.GHVR01166982.1~~GHVR01166982.1.p1  ORF type:complete len:217 (-),score=-28.83 GHVR01166982.1:3125-3775(-)